MRITVKLFGNLRRHLPPDRETLELTVAEGTTVQGVVHQLGVNEGELGITVVDGKMTQEDLPLKDGSCVELYAVIAGGQK